MPKLIINRAPNKSGKYVHLQIKMPLTTMADTTVTETVVNDKDKKVNADYQFGSLVIDVHSPIKAGMYSTLLSKVYTNKGVKKLISKSVKDLDDIKRGDFMRYNLFRLSWIGMVLNDEQPCTWTAFPTDIGAKSIDECVFNMKQITKATINLGPIKEAAALTFTAAGTTGVALATGVGGAYATMAVLDKLTVNEAKRMVESSTQKAAAAAASIPELEQQINVAKAVEGVAQAAKDRAYNDFLTARDVADKASTVARQVTNSSAADSLASDLSRQALKADLAHRDAQLAVWKAVDKRELAEKTLEKAVRDQTHYELDAAAGTAALAEGGTAEYVMEDLSTVTAIVGGVVTAIPFLVAGYMLTHRIILLSQEKEMKRLVDDCFLLTTRPKTLQYCVDNGINGVVAWRELYTAAETTKASSLISLEDEIGVLL